MLELELIDKICCDFEESWDPSQSLEDVKEFVKTHVAETSTDFYRLYSEIAQIDLERRWRDVAHSINLCARENVGEFQIRQQSFPATISYLAMLGQGRHSRALAMELARELAETEFKCRCKFGDSPSPAALGFTDRHSEKYEKLMPVVSIWQGLVCQFEAPLYGKLTVGRQGVNEPEPTKIYRNGDVSKLICAALSEKTISRHQLSFEMVAGRWVKIANESSNRCFRVEKQRVLSPRESEYFQTPCSIVLDFLEIRLNRPLYEK